MLFAVERYAIRASRRFLRRYLSSSSSVDYAEANVGVVKSLDAEASAASPYEKKIVRVAIVGKPNAGKSTLVNSLMKRAVCPASSKVHTTQHNADAVYTEGDTQIVFTDTPGILSEEDKKKYKVKEYLASDPNKSVRRADVIGVLQDVSNSFTREVIHKDVLDTLKEAENKVPLILILNKVDLIKKKEMLLRLTSVLTSKKEHPKFDDVFMISALTRDGVDDLRQYFLDMAVPGKWMYEEHKCSNQTFEKLVAETVRAKLMDSLVNEIPYQIAVKTQYCHVREDGSICTLVDLTCKTDRIARLVMRGKKMKFLSAVVEEDLRNAFQAPVSVLLHVKSKTGEQK